MEADKMGCCVYVQKSMFMKIAQGLVLYFGVNMLMKQFMGGGNNAPQATVKDESGNVVKTVANTAAIPSYQDRPKQLDEGATYNRIPQRLSPIWPADSTVDIVVTLSDSFVPVKIASVPEQYVALKETGYKLGNSSENRVAETTFNVPASVQKNGTLWGHFYIGLTGANLDPKEPNFDPATALHFVYPLTQYIPKKKVAKTRNLLEGKQDDPEEEPEDLSPGPIIANHYHPNISLSFVPGMGVVDYPSMHPATRQFLNLEVSLSGAHSVWTRCTNDPRPLRLPVLATALARTRGTVSDRRLYILSQNLQY